MSQLRKSSTAASQLSEKQEHLRLRRRHNPPVGGSHDALTQLPAAQHVAAVLRADGRSVVNNSSLRPIGTASVLLLHLLSVSDILNVWRAAMTRSSVFWTSSGSRRRHVDHDRGRSAFRRTSIDRTASAIHSRFTSQAADGCSASIMPIQCNPGAGRPAVARRQGIICIVTSRCDPTPTAAPNQCLKISGVRSMPS